jgi:adenylate cyclase
VSDSFEARMVDSVVVKGKTQPMVIYELLSLKGAVTEADQYCIQNSNRAMELFLEGRWIEAELAFKEVLLQKPNDVVSIKMLQRIGDLQNQVEVDTTKVHLFLREK